MRKPKLSAAARGYDYAHQKLAAALLARWTPGDPCAHCGQPMWQRWTVTPTGRRVSAIHLGHTTDRTGYIGLAHAKCNLRDNALRNNPKRKTARVTMRTVTMPSRVKATVTMPAVRHSRAW